MKRVLPLALCAAIAACAPAQMRLPTTIAESSVRTEIVGIGGRDRGQFTAGAYHGSFDRSLERWSFLEAIAREGHSDFTLAGPGLGSPIEGRCGMREHAVGLGSGVEVTVRPMAYRCDLFTNADTAPARFELREVVGGGSAITRYERRGQIDLGAETVRFRSIHHLAGTPMPSLTPIGYVFEQNGRDIGAIELTGRPALMIPAATDPDVVRTVTVAAIALATFWDPAVHDLDM
jgi:hypothetical protein